MLSVFLVYQGTDIIKMQYTVHTKDLLQFNPSTSELSKEKVNIPVALSRRKAKCLLWKKKFSPLFLTKINTEMTQKVGQVIIQSMQSIVINNTIISNTYHHIMDAASVHIMLYFYFWILGILYFAWNVKK